VTHALDLADRLTEVVGARGVLRRPAELFVYRSDGLPGYSKLPRSRYFHGRATSHLRSLAAR
jgi:hypothetical protein